MKNANYIITVLLLIDELWSFEFVIILFPLIIVGILYKTTDQRGTHNHLCSVRILTEKACTHGQQLYMCFVDLEKAFDKASHRKLWQTMVDIGFARHLLDRWKAKWIKNRYVGLPQNDQGEHSQTGSY